MLNGSTPGLFLNRDQSVPFGFCSLGLGFLSPSREETSVLALRRSHIYSAGTEPFLTSTRLGEPQSYLYQKGDDVTWHRRLTLWHQRNIKAGDEGGGGWERKKDTGQRAALREGENVFQLGKGSGAVSEAVSGSQA